MSESKPSVASAQQEKGLEPEEAVKLLNQGNDAVQFSQNSNNGGGGGQAVVNLPHVSGGSTGVGMSKKELMKYANDPFWVRLRTFLFVLFWVVWVAMLVGAVLIIALAPGCPATASLPWWKKCSLARVEVKLPTGASVTPREKISSATAALRKLQDGLGAFKSAHLGGLIVAGLDPFLLDPALNGVGPGNETEDLTEELRKAIAGLNSAVHDDEVKGKILYALTLSQTPIELEWYRKSADATKATNANATVGENSTYAGFYIWRSVQPTVGGSASWYYEIDNKKYYTSHSNRNWAALNYGDASLKEKMKGLVLNWVRTKVDGVQADGDFYVDDPANPPANLASAEAMAEVRKWIKSGGENKALLVTGSSLTGGLLKSNTEAGYFELAPEPELWAHLAGEADELLPKLKKLFGDYEGADKERAKKAAEEAAAAAAAGNKTTDGSSAAAADADSKEKVGLGWRSFTVDYPANKDNRISKKYGLTIAEAVLTAVHLLPKSNPIIVTESSVDASSSPTSSAADSLAHLGSNRLLAALTKLRRDQSESFMLGRTILPEVVTHQGQGQVLAVTRVFKQKNAYLLVVNFASAIQEFEVKGGAGVGYDPAVSQAKVVLADSQNLGIIGTEVDLAKLKLEPKSFVLVELAPKD